MSGVLDGIRVLDFGRYIAGPHCAALLADYGAEVIRLEKIDGNEDRFLFPITENGEGAAFLQHARNKLGMTLNPTKPEGREIVKKLVATADVVVANVPVNVLKTMGIDYESLKAIKSDIILTTSSAFGSIGPYSEKVGFDGVAQAISGNLHLSGFPDRPMKNFNPYVDFTTAILCAYGTVLAILERNKTGKGQIVEGSLLASAVNVANASLMEQSVLQSNREATGNRSPYASPSDAFQTTDGWVFVQAIGQGLFERWVTLVDQPQLLEDPRFKDDLGRGINGEAISEIMAAWCKDKSNAEVLTALEKARLPAGEILTPQECLDHPQVKAPNLLQYTDFPGLSKPAPMSSPPIKLSETPGEIKRRPPTLGEHTDEILLTLGYSGNEIAELRKKRIV
ncbi:MAG: CoA transferase [Pseudomonadales bacterium]|nr:CoA transferase [Pseudomonadales bacterium]